MGDKTKNLKMFINMLISSLLKRKHRIIVALLAIAIGATVLLGMVTIYYDIPLQMGKEFRAYGANLVFVPSNDDSVISIDDVDKSIALFPTGTVIGATSYKYDTAWLNNQPITLVGTDFSQVLKTNPYWQLTGDFPGDKSGVVIGNDIAELMQLAVGSKVELEGFGNDMIVAGIVKTGALEDGFAYIDISALQEPFMVELVELSVTLSSDELQRIGVEIHEKVPTITPRLVKRVTQSETAVLSKLKGLIFLVTFVVLLLTMICVATTMMAVVLERRKEIGLKKAIGAESRSIVLEFLGESVILGCIGGVLGSVCGYLFANLASMNVFGRTISLHIPLVVVTLLVSIVVTVISSLIPVKIAANVEPAVVLRGE